LPCRRERYAHALAAELAKKGAIVGELQTTSTKNASAEGIPATWLTARRQRLAANRGRALIVAGSRQPPSLHAFVQPSTLRSGRGTTVTYASVADADELDAAATSKR